MQAPQLFIPFSVHQSIGGPTTFIQNLQRYLDSVDFPYCQKLKHADGIFFPVEFSLRGLNRVKQNGGTIIQRLDGIFYPEKHGAAYQEYNALLKTIYQEYADFVIFQSEYSRQQCFALLGKKAKQRWTIIRNGADKSIFFPAQKPCLCIDDPVQFVSTGNFRNHDMLEPVIRALDSLHGTFEFHLTLVGPITNPELEVYTKRDYITYAGSKAAPEIAEILRNSHIFLYSHLNPPCPNSVIEAVSCGLPVVGFRSGAMAELCSFSEELLADVSDAVFQRYADFDARQLTSKIAMAVDRYGHYKTLALSQSHLYDFQRCGAQYVTVFQHCLRKNMGVIARIKRLIKKILAKIPAGSSG